MKRNDKVVYHQKGAEELKKLLLDTHQKLAEERLKFNNGSSKDSSVFKKLKYQISLIITLLHKK